MPVRKMTVERAVDAVSEAVRELRAAAANLERALPDEPHQERAVRVMTYECDELTAALATLREHLALGVTDGKDVPEIKAGPQAVSG